MRVNSVTIFLYILACKRKCCRKVINHLALAIYLNLLAMWDLLEMHCLCLSALQYDIADELFKDFRT